MSRQTAREIDRQAADWAARIDRGLSGDEQSRLDAWLAGDPRRLGAFGRMRAIAAQTERAAALGPTYEPSDFAPARGPLLSRRRMLVAGGALAASIAAVGAAGLWRSWSQRVQTRKGEVRQLALQDGSVVTLNTASAVSVQLSETRRGVRLLRGEALFDVAHDPARPFVVTAGGTEVRAVGTSFTVRLQDGGVQVLVREGVVAVRKLGSPEAEPMRLAANTRAVAPVAASSQAGPGPMRIAHVPEAEVQRELAWREGRIAFEGETLAAAAAEFARYSDTRIVITDPGLAREEIAGLYQANDPIGFAQAIATSLRARAEVTDGEVRILRSTS